MKAQLLFAYFILCTPLGLFAQWEADSSINNPVCTAQNKQIFPRSVSDGNGGIISCWQDNRTGNGLYGKIYVQRIDKNGITKWANNGIRLNSNQNDAKRPKIISDGNGGAFVAWIDYRYQISENNNSEADVFAQHVDSAGNILWQQNGIAVDSNEFSKEHISLATDNKGGLYISWDAFQANNSLNAIYAQHLDSTGDLQWGTLSVPISVSNNSAGTYAFEPHMISDGQGGFIACWYDDRSSYTDDIYAQRIDSSGQMKWNSSDVRVCHASEDQRFPTLISNGNNGAIITWEDDRANFNNINPEYDIYVQNLDSNGQQQWLLPGELPGNSTGILVCASNNLQLAPQIVSDNNDGAYICWNDRREGPFNVSLYLQHLNNNGDTTFQANGIKIAGDINSIGYSLSEEDLNLPSMCLNENDTLIVAWCKRVGQIAGDYGNIYAQKIAPNGNPQWDTSGLTISIAIGTQLNVQLVKSINNKTIAVWQDQRAYDSVQTNDDIYTTLFKMDATNTIKKIIHANKIKVYPNPVSSEIHFSIEVDAKLFNILGQKVAQQKNTTQWNISSLPSGVYFLKLSDKKGTILQRTKIIKR